MIDQSKIGLAIRYPDCWDTAAYPTLESALHELAAWFMCDSECQQRTAASIVDYSLDLEQSCAKPFESVAILLVRPGPPQYDESGMHQDELFQQVRLTQAKAKEILSAMQADQINIENEQLRELIASDSFAACFQSLAQYRSALIGRINEIQNSSQKEVVQ